MKGESYNYTVVVWKDGATQPCHIEGPFMASSCDQRLDVTTYGLHRSQHYTAMVAAYNENISIKSKKIDLCMSLIVVPVLLCRLMYITMAILYLHAIMHITLAHVYVRIIIQRYVLPFDAQVVTNTPSISYLQHSLLCFRYQCSTECGCSEGGGVCRRHMLLC